MRKWLQKSVVAFLLLVGMVAGAVFLLAATESGTRWLVTKAEPYFPAALTVTGVSGTLLSGLDIQRAVWQDKSVDVSVAAVAVNFELRPLLRRHLVINSLSAQELRVVSRPGTDSVSREEPVALNVPIRVTVETADLRDLQFTSPERVFAP